MSAAITPEQAARDCSAQIEKDRATLEEAGIAAWPAVRFATGAHLREALALLDAERAARQEAERERDAYRSELASMAARAEAAEAREATVARAGNAARAELLTRPDPGALLAALDTIRAAAATGARPAELARMVEDVQAGMIRPPTGDATLLTTKEPS